MATFANYNTSPAIRNAYHWVQSAPCSLLSRPPYIAGVILTLPPPAESPVRAHLNFKCSSHATFVHMQVRCVKSWLQLHQDSRLIGCDVLASSLADTPGPVAFSFCF